MNITNQEKQILQKYYAEQIKSRSTNLKDIIQRDDQAMLEDVLGKIANAGVRILEIKRDWKAMQHEELQKLETEVEEGYKNNE